jgi:hypothetical protein
VVESTADSTTIWLILGKTIPSLGFPNIKSRDKLRISKALPGQYSMILCFEIRGSEEQKQSGKF